MEPNDSSAPSSARLSSTLWGLAGGGLLAGVFAALDGHFVRSRAAFTTLAGGLFGFGISSISGNKPPGAMPVAALAPATSHAHGATPSRYTDGSITVQFAFDGAIAPGQPRTGTITLRHAATGAPLTKAELEEVHTEKYHLLLVDSTLTDFHHLHPQETTTPGVYQFQFTPRTGHDYHAWSDLMLTNGTPHQIHTHVAGSAPTQAPVSVPAITHVQSHGVTFRLQQTEPLRVGQQTMLHIEMVDVHGKPVNNLQELLGATAHFVGFGADGRSFIHSHAMGAPSNGTLDIPVIPTHAGPVRFYLQVQREGHMITVPFGAEIYPARQSHVARTTQPAPHGGHQR